MTLDDVFFSLHQTARRAAGGISGVARRLGKREKTLMTKLDPADDTHQPTVGEWQAILLDTGDLQSLEAFAAIFDCKLVTRTAETSVSVMTAVLHAVTEHGDVARAIDEAMEDGEITPQERARIIREISEARRALDILENTLASVVVGQETGRRVANG